MLGAALGRWLRRLASQPPQPPPERPPAATAGALVRLDATASADPALAPIPLHKLLEELTARLEASETLRFLEIPLARRVEVALARGLDIHENRFAPTRYRHFAVAFQGALPPGYLADKTVLDLGCGTQNPFGMAFVFLACGARRAIVADTDPVQDMAQAARALAECAAVLLIQPERILGRFVLAPARILQNLEGFDLPRLAAGEPAGIPADRLQFRREGVDTLTLPSESIDLATSVSLFEHLANVPAAIDALYRVTRPGGHGIHLLDGADHRTYTGEVASQFEFLKEATDDPLVHGSNRLRSSQLCALFDERGFAIRSVEDQRRVPLTAEDQAAFVEPFRSMPREELERVCALITVRRED